MNDLINAYLDTWNSAPGDARHALLERHWSADVTYTDPLAAVAGREGVSAVIDAVHAQFPGFVFSHVGAADSHHSQTRFQWGLGPAGADPIIIGFDVLVTDDAGRIRTVLGFLDQVPG